MVTNPDEHEGIACMNPACGAVDQYKGGQNKKRHEYVMRHKTCKVCGTVFKTVEAPISVVTIKNDHVSPETTQL